MQVETLPGGTRWNPTQEQIGLLEMLYRGGMRTPNAQQIEQITAQLEKYGKIEGKNVFYWFQNHKARERQKQKRNSLGLGHCPRTYTATIATIAADTIRVWLVSKSPVLLCPQNSVAPSVPKNCLIRKMETYKCILVKFF